MRETAREKDEGSVRCTNEMAWVCANDLSPSLLDTPSPLDVSPPHRSSSSPSRTPTTRRARRRQLSRHRRSLEDRRLTSKPPSSWRPALPSLLPSSPPLLHRKLCPSRSPRPEVQTHSDTRYRR